MQPHLNRQTPAEPRHWPLPQRQEFSIPSGYKELFPGLSLLTPGNLH